MVDRKYLERLGLKEGQITLLMDALEKESKFRSLLGKERVSSAVIESIMKVTDLENMDLSNEDLIREKIRLEWGEFIPKQSGNVQIWAQNRNR